MTKEYILAIDQGTTGTTMLLVDKKCQIIHKHYQSFPQSYPKPGWVEHNPESIWETVRNGIKEMLTFPGITPENIQAIGITNQRETIVIWDRATGKPVYPAIVWQCRRTAQHCAQLIKNRCSKLVESRTGLRLDPYFSATKIQWILNQVPGLKTRAANGELACGTIDAWLIWKLTGGRLHATDYSNASRTMLFNIHKLIWDQELLRLFEIPPLLMPTVKNSADDFGRTDPGITGTAIPITGVLGDQQAALFGQGCLEPGMMKNTYGTGCFLLMNTGQKPYPPKNGLLTSIAWGIDQQLEYVLEGSVFNGGTVIQWLRDELGILEHAADSETLAEKVTDTNGVYFVPAFTGLGAPYWDPYARGVIAGLTRGVNRAHIVRAALEGIAFQVREVIDIMVNTSKTRPNVLRVDGGAAANNFLLQFQADICNLTIQRNKSLELTAIGAAFIAGIGVGLWKNTAELKGLIALERTFTPRMDVTERDRLYRGWNRAVEKTKGWVEHF